MKNQEQKTIVAEALRLHHEAYEKHKEAEELWNKVGITTCTSTYGFESEIHIFRGIKKLAEILGTETEPATSYDGEKDYSKAVLTLPSGVKCFELGTPIMPNEAYEFK